MNGTSAVNVLDTTVHTNEGFVDISVSEDQDNRNRNENSPKAGTTVCLQKVHQVEPIVVEESNNDVTTFKLKLVNSVFIFWNMATLGMTIGQIGPVLPDLQRITGSSLQEVSWLFTGYGIGYFVGCLLSGFTIEKFNTKLLQCVHTLCTALTTAALPWVPILNVSVIVRVMTGIAVGGQLTLNHAMLFRIWRTKSGPYNMIMHTALAVGGILSPLFTQPFLRNVEESHESHNGIGTPELSTTQLTPVNATDTVHLPEVISVQYAFVITAVLTMSSAFSFLLSYVCQVKDISSPMPDEQNSRRETLPVNLKYLVLVLLHIVAFFSRACIRNFQYFLPTFVIRQLDWSQHSSATLNSVFHITLACGNLFGILLSKVSTTTKVSVAAFVATILCLTACTVGSIFGQTVVVWITATVPGLAMALIPPTQFTWTQENVTHVTGRIVSTMLVSGSTGLMLYPVLVGYLMDVYSPMWFLYFNIGAFTLCLILFALAVAVTVFSTKTPVQENSVA